MGKNQNSYSICIIGAGFSGICAAVQLQRKLGFENFTILERNDDFGGVWWSNRYPGCATDVVSHLYSLSFEPNSDWTRGYVPQSEMLVYLRNVAAKHGLYHKTKFGCTVEHLVWDDHNSQWKVYVRNRSGLEELMTFSVVLNGQGRFSLPKVPEQFAGFKNHVLHTAMWDNTVPLMGKRVAVVGTGSTAVQLIPAIAPRVERLFIYMRNPPTIVPAVPVVYSPWKRWCFKYIPFVRWIYRFYLFLQTEQYFPYFLLGSKLNHGAKAFCQFLVQQTINNVQLREKLTPTYEFGCKRIIPSVDFYSTLNRENVEVITESILKVEENSIISSDRKKCEVDVLILATGFHVQDTYGSFKVIGKDSADIHEEWKKNYPSAYLGIMTSKAPNYFILLGPNTAPSYTSILVNLECQVHWITQVLKRLIRDERKTVTVLPDAEKSYMKEIHDKLSQKVYMHPSCGGCNSWYKNANGIVAEIYPDRVFQYWKDTYFLRYDHLIFK